MLMPAPDRASTTYSRCTDLRLAQALRGRPGFLLGTRPGLNLMAARLRVPGLTTIALSASSASPIPSENSQAL